MSFVVGLLILAGLVVAAGLCGGWIAGRKTPEMKNIGFLCGGVGGAAALFAVWVLGWLRLPLSRTRGQRRCGDPAGAFNLDSGRSLPLSRRGIPRFPYRPRLIAGIHPSSAPFIRGEDSTQDSTPRRNRVNRVAMIDTRLEEMLTARRQRMAAHDDWVRAFLAACESLKRGSPLLADRQIDEAFKRFVKASESFGVFVGERRMPPSDLAAIKESFASLSTSAEILNRKFPSV